MINFSTKELSAAAVAPGATAQALRAALEASAELQVIPSATEAEAEQALRKGKVVALVRQGGGGDVQVACDPK
ncbi:MAG: hypothetical protein AAB537_02205, partial [Patescibacteria group bacterium]